MHGFRLSFRCTCLTYYADSSVVVCLDNAIGKDTKIIFFGMLCSETFASPKRTAKFGGSSPSRARQNVESGFAEKLKRLLQSYDARHESEGAVNLTTLICHDISTIQSNEIVVFPM